VPNLPARLDGILSDRRRPQLGEFAEVLDGCGDVELVLGSVWSPEAKAVEAQDLLQMLECAPEAGQVRRSILTAPGFC
jgi:hypothetical protein